jgi:hypothetical protein
MIPTTLCWANLSLRLREPPPQVARTSASGCANLRLRLREPPPPVAQLPFPKYPPQVAQTSASGCANLRLRLRKPPPQVAQTSASGCAKLRLRGWRCRPLILFLLLATSASPSSTGGECNEKYKPRTQILLLTATMVATATTTRTTTRTRGGRRGRQVLMIFWRV